MFAYFDPAAATGDGLPARDAIALLAVFAVTAGAAFVEFERQDL